jgi:inner membrane protein YidH
MRFFIGQGDLQIKPSVVSQRESHFSWLRTRMSLERTLMSWVRTATALIGFGFTIFQFFERFNETAGVAAPRHPGTVRTIALGLVGAGVGALIVAILEYRATLRYLWTDEFQDIAGMQGGRQVTPAIIVAIFLAFVGLFAFGAIAIRTTGGS